MPEAIVARMKLAYDVGTAAIQRECQNIAILNVSNTLIGAKTSLKSRMTHLQDICNRSNNAN